MKLSNVFNQHRKKTSSYNISEVTFHDNFRKHKRGVATKFLKTNDHTSAECFQISTMRLVCLNTFYQF